MDIRISEGRGGGWERQKTWLAGLCMQFSTFILHQYSPQLFSTNILHNYSPQLFSTNIHSATRGLGRRAGRRKTWLGGLCSPPPSHGPAHGSAGRYTFDCENDSENMRMIVMMILLIVRMVRHTAQLKDMLLIVRMIQAGSNPCEIRVKIKPDQISLVGCLLCFWHLVVWIRVKSEPDQIVDLIGGYRVGFPQLLGELVHAPQQQHRP